MGNVDRQRLLKWAQSLIYLLNMKIVLNVVLAKQKGNGGFNVAVNFFNKTLNDKENEWFYFVSKEFDREMKGIENGLDEDHYYVFHSQPNLRYYFKEKSLIRKAEACINPDVIYSILAPSYFSFKTIEVMRCANAWTVVGGVNKYVLDIAPLKLKIRHRLKAQLTRFQMRKTRFFITQTEIAKKCILRTVSTTPENVCVVSNVLPEKYLKMSYEKIRHDGFNMIYASSPAFHKDYIILPQVASILVNKYGMNNFKIHITIPNYAISQPIYMNLLKKYGVEGFFVNHGTLKQEELTQVFCQCDIGLFPSLLETFSMTLLEYMYFKLPIVASDLDFNKEVAKDAAIYFKPHDAEDFAEKIYEVYSNHNIRASLIDKAIDRLAIYSNNTEKYDETVSFLHKVANKMNNNHL